MHLATIVTDGFFHIICSLALVYSYLLLCVSKSAHIALLKSLYKSRFKLAFNVIYDCHDLLTQMSLDTGPSAFSRPWANRHRHRYTLPHSWFHSEQTEWGNTSLCFASQVFKICPGLAAREKQPGGIDGIVWHLAKSKKTGFWRESFGAVEQATGMQVRAQLPCSVKCWHCAVRTTQQAQQSI